MRLGRVLKLMLWLALAGTVGLVGFAIVSELPAPVRQIEVPLDLPAARP